MSYVLCSVKDCTHHDGEGCTLETVEIFKPFIRITTHDRARTAPSMITTPFIMQDIGACRDYEPMFAYH